VHRRGAHGFLLRSLRRSDGAAGGLLRVTTGAQKPPWMVAVEPFASAESPEAYFFRAECSATREETGTYQWLHLRHEASGAYLNCVDGVYLRGHATHPDTSIAAQREPSTGLEVLSCDPRTISSKVQNMPTPLRRGPKPKPALS
jgi:hypothetical protein